MYPKTIHWKNWMKDYQFGTFAVMPKGEISEISNSLRQQLDPNSAKTSHAHITITQPLLKAPSAQQISIITEIIQSYSFFKIQIGPAVPSPNNRLIWLNINPKEPILEIRNKLHQTKLFNLELPFTNNFIPHLTLSEAQREPGKVDVIIKKINSKYKTHRIMFNTISWIIPDDNFVFHTYKEFSLYSPKN